MIEQRWGFKAVVVDVLEDETAREAIAIAELRRVSESDPLPDVSSWVNIRELSKSEIDGAGRSIVERLLNDGATGLGAFSRFGWIEEALDWISVEADIDRAQFTRDIKQFNAAAGSALVRFGRRFATPIWFKAVEDLSASEYRMTRTLAQHFPNFLPAVIATREDWKAWAMEDAGAPISSVCSPGAFGKAVSRLAELQKASMSSTSSILSAGCSDQRLPVLRANIRPLMDLIRDAMARQDDGVIQRLTSARIRALEAILADACLELEGLQIPDALLHGDLSFENILVGPRGLVFTDWASAAVGNPFVTFEQLRAQIEQEKDAHAWLGNAFSDEVAQVMLVHLGQGLGRDRVGAPFASIVDGGLQPSFLDPREYLVFPYAQCPRQAFQREEVAADLAHKKAISLKHAADGFRGPAHSAGDLFDRVPDEFVANRFDFRLAPAPVVGFALEPVLDDEPPAGFSGLSAVALKTHHQLFELVAGENSGLGGERHGCGAPAPGLGITRGRISHRCLGRGVRNGRRDRSLLIEPPCTTKADMSMSKTGQNLWKSTTP